MKQFLFLCFAILAFIFASSYAAAGDAEISWVVPESRLDGSQFNADEVSRYEICVSIEGEECDKTYTVAGDKTLINLADVIPPGGVPVNFKIRLFDKDGLASDWSNTVSKKEKAVPLSITILIR